MTTRAVHHARPPAAISKASAPSLVDQLRALHEALVAYGDRLDYRVDSNKLHPAFAQQRRHAAKHALLNFAVLLKHHHGVDPAQALPPDWVAAVERAEGINSSASSTTEPGNRAEAINPPPSERTAT